MIWNKARATKAGVRAKYQYLPPNQFNIDLCLDIVQVLNQIAKKECDKSPYEVFTGRAIDIMHDFHIEWGEPIIVKRNLIQSYRDRTMGCSSENGTRVYI
jgi:hypothetical protein